MSNRFSGRTRVAARLDDSYCRDTLGWWWRHLLHSGPSERMLRRVERNQHPSSVFGRRRLDAAAPGYGAHIAGGIDPQRVGPHGDFTYRMRALDKRTRLHARKPAGQAREARVQMVEHNALIGTNFVDALIGRRIVEVAAVHGGRQRLAAPIQIVPAFGSRAEKTATHSPTGGQRCEARGFGGAFLDAPASVLQVWQATLATAPRCGRRHAHRVGVARSGPLVTQRHALKALAVSQVTLLVEPALPEHRQRLCKVSYHQACNQALRPTRARREGITNQRHIDALLERRHVGRCVDGPLRIIVPEIIARVETILYLSEASLPGA